MESLTKNVTIPFQVELLDSGVPLPEALASGLSTNDEVQVEGVLDGFPFRALLESKILKIGAPLRKAVGASPGQTVAVELTRIEDEPEIRVPSDLAEALTDHPGALVQWKATTPKARRDWVLWILTAKQARTRKTRVAKACDMLASGKGRVCCFGGLNWLIKGHPISPEETWQL